MSLSSRELVVRASHILRDAGVESPEVDARLLAAHVLGVAPLAVLLTDVPVEREQDFWDAVTRRAEREPLQHITGTASFGPCELQVGPGVFIPRPETEMLAAWAVSALQGRESPVVVDLGTGSGALAIFIAHAVKNARVIAVEFSERARKYAAANAQANGVNIEMLAGDMTDPELLTELSESVDMVVTNPPYVPSTPELSKEVYFDPPEAVFSGADGMDAIRGLVPVATRLLKPGGWLGIEHDDTTSHMVEEILAATSDFSVPVSRKDLSGRDRFVTASKVSQVNTLL